MASLHRVVVAWTGPQIKGSAVNVLYWDASVAVTPDVASIRTAYNGIAAQLPTGVSIQVPGAGDTIDPATGLLTAGWSATTPAAVAGTAGANAAGGVGCCISWDTSTVFTGRRLRGRTFIVPLPTNQYDTDGTLTPACVTAMTTFATALRGVSGFAIWHRPTAKGASNGGFATVSSGKVRDKVAFLKSRRD